MKKNIITIVIVIAVIAAAGYKLAINAQVAKSKAYMPDLSKAVVVKGQKVQKTTFDYSFSYSGTFIPNREIMLIPQAQGEVKAVSFNEGDHVSQGQVLLQIDDALLQSQLIAAKAAFENAKSNYDRFKNAATSEGITKMQVESSWLQMKSSESQLKQLQIAIQKCKLVAPFSGTISKRDVELGSVVGQAPVGRLTDVSSLKLEANIPESDVIYFDKGNTVQIKSELFPTESFHGKVDFVSSRGDESHNYVVKFKVDNSSRNKLKAGMYGTVLLNKNLSVSALTIPRTALLGSAKKPQVYVVENGKAVLRSLVTGRSNGNVIEVLNGIQQGETVVSSGQINLVDGCKVELAK